MSISLALTVHNAVMAACTIVGVSIGDPADKTTWSINYGVTPPPVCAQQAQAVITAFDLDAWNFDVPINEQIDALEATETPRRIREAIEGTDGGWLKNQDGQIAALRAQLKPLTK